VFLLFTKISLERKWVDPITKTGGSTNAPANNGSVNVKPSNPEEPPAQPNSKPVKPQPSSNDKPAVVTPKNDPKNPKIPNIVVKPTSNPSGPPPKNPKPLSPEEELKRDMNNLFNVADKNRNFQLSLEEFKDFLVISLTAGGDDDKIINEVKNKPLTQFKQIFDRSDKDQNGSLSWDEVWNAQGSLSPG
jgi:hypothetical protein